MPDTLFDDGSRGAVLSEDGVYRYSLTRRWGIGGQPVLFVGLNPSTADGEKDDRTVGRMVTFATTWGAPALELVNLYAYRSTDPRGLVDVEDPCGPENDDAIAAAAARARFALVCWGSPAFTAFERRTRRVYELLLENDCCDVRCLRTTKDGHPWHPLYVPGTTLPTRWEPPRG